MHAGGVVAAFQGAGRAGGFINERAEAAIDACLGTVITSHAIVNSRTAIEWRLWARRGGISIAAP